ncbi:MAG: hypothetical protein ABIS86_01555 [Streptosporangiaceae bacterium]
MRVPLATGLAVLALPLASCSGAARDAAAARPPALTTAQAGTVLRTYEQTNAKANKALDPTLLATVETGPQLQMDVALYTLNRATGKKLTPFSYQNPVFYIPRLTGHPRWFAVDAASTVRDQQIRHALLFVQDADGGPWKLAADPQRNGSGPIGGVAVDDAGYARVPTPAKLALTPGRLATAHAALLGGGPKAPGAAGLAAGPLTTGTYELMKKAGTQIGTAGISFSAQFSPATPQTYALATQDGGALVWYVLRQKETYAPATTKAKKIPITGDLVGLAPRRSVRHLTSTVLIQYLAVIPRKGDVTVSGATRKAVSADTT